MRTNTLVALIAVALVGGSSIAMAKGGGGGSGGGMGHGGVSHGHFGHHFHRFLRNQVFFGDGWGWGPYSGDGANTTVFVQQSVPRFPVAGVTGSTPATPCHWNAETFSVPSSKGGTGPVQVVSCR